MDSVVDEKLPTLADIQEAAGTLAGVALRTPLLPALELGRQIGADLFLKCENLQKTGSFKLRGAYKIGRASCRERVWMSVGAGSLTTTNLRKARAGGKHLRFW